MQSIDNNYPVGFSDENDLLLKNHLLIRILQVVASFAIVLVGIRFFQSDNLMLIVDLIFVLVSLIGIYCLKKSIANTPIITNIILLIFFIQVSVMFTHQGYHFLGPSWFIVLVIFTFYQAGISKGIVVSLSSTVAILTLGQTLENSYSLTQYMYTLVPFLVASVITYLYESKVLDKEKLLSMKNIEQKKLIEEKEELLQHAHYDALTHLPNRVLFQDRLKQAILKTNRSNKDFAVLFIDLDRFKEINDSLGHSVGDTVLCEIASRLQNTLRKEDTISRFGGDEFLCIVEQLESCKSIASLARKLIEATRQPIVIWDETVHLTCSIGISIYIKDAENEKDLLRHADTAMYKAKDLGKDNYQFYTPC